jgi:hypothetical protein
MKVEFSQFIAEGNECGGSKAKEKINTNLTITVFWDVTPCNMVIFMFHTR